MSTVPKPIFEKMREDPRIYCRNSWNHPNDPSRKYDFRTNDGEPLHYIADDKGPWNPDEWADINILLMARGCLKTTTVLGATTWALDMYPNMEAFMTAPREDPPIVEFVDKFKNAVADTPLAHRRVKDNQSHQKFETKLRGQNGEFTAYSHLKTQSGWSKDKLRAPHCHIGILDEFQDMDEGAFSMILEVVDRDHPNADWAPAIFAIGTPKLKNSFFHNLWKKSNQRTWDGKKGEWVDQNDVGLYVPDQECDECGMQVGAAQECPRCEADIEIDEDESFTVKAWHIDQPNSPLHDEGRINFKRETLSEMEWHNEVLAQFHSPEDDLLTNSDVRAVFNSDIGFRNTRQWDDSYGVLSVDWGGGQSKDASDTVLMFGERMDMGEGITDSRTTLGSSSGSYEHVIQNVSFLDHDFTQDQELAEVRDWMSNFDPDIVLVDEGHAGNRREKLQEDFFETVKGVGYGNVTPKDDVKWRENDQERRVFVTVDKSHTAENMVDAVKDLKFTIPSKDLSFATDSSDGTKLIKQLTAPYKEFDTTPSGTKKLKVMSDRNDDAFDTLNYQYLGAVKLPNLGPTLTTIALNDRF